MRVGVMVAVGAEVEAPVGVNGMVGVLVGLSPVGTARVKVLVGRGGGRWVLVRGGKVLVAMGGGGAVGVLPAFGRFKAFRG